MKTKKHKRVFQWWWVVVPAVFVVALVAYGMVRRSTQQFTNSSYQVYEDSRYGFTVEYPRNWEVAKDTHVFENGDVVAFQIKGPTQKRYTEFIDGARFIVSKPFTIDTDLEIWMKGYFDDQAKFSKLTLAKYPFEAVEDCSQFGCMQYVFTTINVETYGVVLFAQGTSKEKAAYENALLYMLKSLTFTKDY